MDNLCHGRMVNVIKEWITFSLVDSRIRTKPSHTQSQPRQTFIACPPNFNKHLQVNVNTTIPPHMQHDIKKTCRRPLVEPTFCMPTTNEDKWSSYKQIMIMPLTTTAATLPKTQSLLGKNNNQPTFHLQRFHIGLLSQSGLRR